MPSYPKGRFENHRFCDVFCPRDLMLTLILLASSSQLSKVALCDPREVCWSGPPPTLKEHTWVLNSEGGPSTAAFVETKLFFFFREFIGVTLVNKIV